MSSTSDSKTTETIPLQYAVIIYQQTSGPGQWGDRATQADNGALMFTGWLSESFSYSAGAQYDSPFQTVIGSGLAPLLRLGGVKFMPPVLTGQLWSGSETPELSIDVELAAETDPLLEIRDPIKNLLKLVTPKLGMGGATLESPGPYIDPNEVWNQLRQVFPLLNDLPTKSSEGTQPAVEQKTGVVNQQAANKNKPTAKQTTTTNSAQQATAENDDTEVAKKVSETDQRIKNSITNQISLSIGQYVYFPSIVVTNVQCEFHNQIGPNGWPMQATVSITFKPMFLPTQTDLDTMFGAS